jgi:hypothetical protein
MRFRLTLSFLFISVISFAQPYPVKQQAQEMGNALVRKDYKTFVEFSFPKILKEMGGKEKMAESIAKQMQGLESAGSRIISISAGDPAAFIKAGKELQTTIQQQMTIKVKEGKIVSKTTLIAISQDNGKHWYFVDAGERDLAAIRKTLPNLSKALVITKPGQPQFIRN